MMSSEEKSSKETVRWQLFCGIVASLSNISYGTNLASSSIVLPPLQKEPNTEGLFLTIDQGSWFASLFALGCLSGSLIGGFQSCFLGRKKSMMLDNALIIIGLMLIATTNSYHILLIGRYLSGHGTGSCVISLPAYLNEISHPKVRGTLIGIFGAMYYVGSFIIMTIGALLPWRIAIGACVAFPIITNLGLLFCPESPLWLLRSGDREGAIRVLKYFRGSEEAAFEALSAMEEILERGKMETLHETKSSYIMQFRQHLLELCCPTFLRPFCIILYLLGVTQIWSGSPFITLYMVSFFEKMNIPMDPYIASSAISVNRLVFGLLSIQVLSKYSKKTIFLIITCIMALTNGAMGAHQFLSEKGYLKEWEIDDLFVIRMFPFISIFIFYAALSLGFGTIPKMLTGELLPSKKRSIGSGILGFVEGFSNFTAAKVSPTFMTWFHPYGCFTIFTVNLFVGSIVAYFCLPETKGRSLEEIENYYYDMKMNKNKDKSIP